MAHGDPEILRFGVFEANLRTSELRREGVPVRLQFQPFLVLRALLERAGEMVTRDELRRAIWPDALFVDFELGLNRGVSKLRRALGDTVGNPRFVETLPRRGYRFIAPVSGQAPRRRPGNGERRWSCHLVWSAREVVLVDGDNVVGRAEDSGVRIDADTVSRHHARIVVSGKNAILEDLGSRNGTFLWGRLIDGPEPLVTGAEITFGAFPVLFRVASASRTTRTLRRP